MPLLVLELDEVALDKYLAHGNDELLVRHVGVELQEADLLIQEELHLHLLLLLLLGRLEGLEAIDLIHHLLDILVKPLDLLLRLEAQLLLGGHRLLQGLAQLLLRLQLLDQVLALLPLALEVAEDVQAGLAFRIELLPEGGLLAPLCGQLLLELLHVLLAAEVLVHDVPRFLLFIPQLAHRVTVGLLLIIQLGAQLLDGVEASLELREEVLPGPRKLRLQHGLLSLRVLQLHGEAAALVLLLSRLLLELAAGHLALLQQSLQGIDVPAGSRELALQRLPVLPLPLELCFEGQPHPLLLQQLALHLLPRLLLRLQQLLQVAARALLLLQLRLHVHAQLLLRLQPLLEIHLHPQLAEDLRVLGHLPPVLHAVLDPLVVHDLQALSLQLE
mmetsp:Transcript_3068/g.10362  ORF Transcript_3068/g.10362 Transcript_3068/m.10362 type:complete len:387 (+) Transcript_3068:127-1287(+)